MVVGTGFSHIEIFGLYVAKGRCQPRLGEGIWHGRYTVEGMGQVALCEGLVISTQLSTEFSTIDTLSRYLAVSKATFWQTYGDDEHGHTIAYGATHTLEVGVDALLRAISSQV